MTLSFLSKRYQIFSRYFLVLLLILIITYVIPKEIKFKYEFELGKPWRYDNLLAPFDYGITKTEEEIQIEKQHIVDNFIPYYEVDPEVLSKVKRNFRDAFLLRLPILRDESISKGLKIDSAQVLIRGIEIIESIYSNGIIELDTLHKDFSKESIFYLLSGNKRENRFLKDIYTLESADQFTDQESEEGLNFAAQLIKADLEPNILYKISISEKALEDELGQVSGKRGKVRRGQKIIYTGEIINDEKFQLLSSLKLEFVKYRSGYQLYTIWGGYLILVAAVLILYTVFLLLFSRDVFKSQRKLTFVLLLIMLMVFLSIYGVQKDFPSLYIIPFCIVPIVLRTFFGARLAFNTHLCILLISSLIVPYGSEFIFIHTIAGLVAIFTNLKAHYWSQFFASIGYIFVAYCLSYLGIAMIQEGNINNIEWTNFGWLTVNVFFTFLAYPLIPIFEKLFGVVSEITLIELTDSNKPLLKELSLKAPGTAQHSFMVAHLAEAAASEVGGNPLLVKVGALYHDIGKMNNAQYFIENQNTEYNPHDELTFEQSAAIIIEHVSKGVEMARKARLPGILIDFIRTHHGNTRVEYFYQSFLNNYPDEEIDESKFRYPGPLPYSKETALVMLADSVEAASRSLRNHTEEGIEKLVDGIFQHKIDHEQLIQADVTFKDIVTTKKIFKKMLKSIYHVRVAYPERVSSKQ